MFMKTVKVEIKLASPFNMKVSIETYWFLFIPVYRKEELISYS